MPEKCNTNTHLPVAEEMTICIMCASVVRWKRQRWLQAELTDEGCKSTASSQYKDGKDNTAPTYSEEEQANIKVPKIW